MVQVSRMRVVAWESRVPSLELLLISLMRDVSSFYKEKVSGVIFTFLGSLSLNISESTLSEITVFLLQPLEMS